MFCCAQSFPDFQICNNFWPRFAITGPLDNDALMWLYNDLLTLSYGLRRQTNESIIDLNYAFGLTLQQTALSMLSAGLVSYKSRLIQDSKWYNWNLYTERAVNFSTTWTFDLWYFGCQKIQLPKEDRNVSRTFVSMYHANYQATS